MYVTGSFHIVFQDYPFLFRNRGSTQRNLLASCDPGVGEIRKSAVMVDTGFVVFGVILVYFTNIRSKSRQTVFTNRRQRNKFPTEIWKIQPHPSKVLLKPGIRSCAVWLWTIPWRLFLATWISSKYIVFNYSVNRSIKHDLVTLRDLE